MKDPNHFKTPCGFEIWLIPSWLESGDYLGWRAFFEGEEIGFDRLRGRLSRAGALMLADKIKQLYGSES